MVKDTKTTPKVAVHIPINKIVFTPSMVRAYEEHKTEYPDRLKKFRVTPTENTVGKMERMDEALAHSDDFPESEFDPIEVKHVISGTASAYFIINGRHRTVSRALQGHTEILAEIECIVSQ